MGVDVVPSGFSSAAAVALLRTMKATMGANSSFIASSSLPTIDASSRTTVSGDTVFSIIAAAARSKSSAGSALTTHASASQSQTIDNDVSSTADDGQAVGGAQALAGDPNFQKNYSVDQAAQNYYAQLDQLAESMRRTAGETKPGQTNGQILSDYLKLTGDSATDFANKFDNKSLKIVDASTLGIGAKAERYWIESASGEVIGSGGRISADEAALNRWQAANPRSSWTDDHGHQGGGGLMVTW